MRILLAEDEGPTRRMTARALRRWGYIVEEAVDGDEAWRALQADDPPRIVILDWTMPGLEGPEVCRRLRAAPSAWYTYVILLTGRVDTEDVVEGFEAGADDYVKKPFPIEELRARVRSGQRIVQLEHEAAEQARRSALFSRFADAASQAFCMAAPDGSISYANPGYCMLVGVDDPSSVLGRSFVDHYVAASQATVVEQVLPAARAGRPWTGELMVRSLGGGIRRTLESHFAVPDSAGRAPHTAMVATDITERERSQIERSHAQRLESVGRLAAGIAHEINTPIQFVRDSLSFLEEAYSDLYVAYQALRGLIDRADFASGREEALARIAQLEEEADLAYLEEYVPDAFARTLEGTRRVAEIVRSMKSFSHKGDGDMAPADVNQALRDTLVVARNVYKYLADVEVDYGELPQAVVDIGSLKQVFLNLVINATHAIQDRSNGAQRGTIRVRTAQEDGQIRVEVADDGCGIPKDNLPVLFDPFFTTKEVGRGTGQGLALAHTVVVEKHRGRILVDSPPGEGTTFTLLLPTVPPSTLASSDALERYDGVNGKAG